MTMDHVNALKAWRLERSRDLDVPAYKILTNKTIQHIADATPKTIAAPAHNFSMPRFYLCPQIFLQIDSLYENGAHRD